MMSFVSVDDVGAVRCDRRRERPGFWAMYVGGACEAPTAHALRLRRIWKAIGHRHITPEVSRPTEEVLVVIVPPHAWLAAQAVEKGGVMYWHVTDESDLIGKMVLRPEVRVIGWNAAERNATLGATTFHGEVSGHDRVAPRNARAILAQSFRIVGALIGKWAIARACDSANTNAGQGEQFGGFGAPRSSSRCSPVHDTPHPPPAA